MNLTKKELADAAGYACTQLIKIDNELPEDEKIFVEVEKGKCDLALFIQRLVNYNVRNLTIKEFANAVGYTNGKLLEINGLLPDDKKLLVEDKDGRYDIAVFIRRWAEYRLSNLTKKDMANAAGYTYRRLYDIDKSLPEDKKLFVESKDGKCDLALFIQRWVEYNVSRDDTEGLSLDEIKAQHEAVKMRKTELVVSQMEGNLVDVNEIKLLWGNIANTVMQNLVKLPQKIAVQVVGMQITERIAAVIDEEIRNVLTAMSDVPLPKIEGGADGETERDEGDGE